MWVLGSGFLLGAWVLLLGDVDGVCVAMAATGAGFYLGMHVEALSVMDFLLYQILMWKTKMKTCVKLPMAILCSANSHP